MDAGLNTQPLNIIDALRESILTRAADPDFGKGQIRVRFWYELVSELYAVLIKRLNPIRIFKKGRMPIRGVTSVTCMSTL